MEREIYIYFDDALSAEPLMVGLLTAQQVRGHEVFSFEFTEDWLKNSHCRLLDPDLQLFSGRQYLPENKTNFGLFLDSSPDRWGRVGECKRYRWQSLDCKISKPKRPEKRWGMGSGNHESRQTMRH